MRWILLPAFFFFSASLLSQNLSNYEYARMQQPQYSDWTCGSKTFVATADILINVPADGWVLELQGTEEQPTLTDTRAKMQVRVDGLLKKLTAHGIAATDVTVSTVSQEKVSGYRMNEKGVTIYTTVAYSLTKSLLIHYKDPVLYSTIISEASVFTLDNVTQSYCTVADEQAVYAELYRQAMDVVFQKRDADVSYYNALLSPDEGVTDETYDVQLPDPNTAQRAGAQRTTVVGYDRVLSPEYGANAVKYTIHINYTYTLQKPTKVIQPKTKNR